MSAETQRRGFVLLVVLVFALLLTADIATLARRVVVDTMIVRNREHAAQAEALARGGVRLAVALLLEDRLREQDPDAPPGESLADPWARPIAIQATDDGVLLLDIEDAAARLNLNALFRGGEPLDETELFLDALLEKVIEEMPGRPEEKVYERQELVRNLIDWVDADALRQRGGDEDAYYQQQDPPYRCANRALLSVNELRQVEGFDARLVEALDAYVTVYPYAEGGGINPNTAPPHVLALLYVCELGNCSLAGENDVRDILRLRQEGLVFCETAAREPCVTLREVFRNGSIFPPPSYASAVFRVVALARVGELERRLTAVIDRSAPEAPLRLSWRMR